MLLLATRVEDGRRLNYDALKVGLQRLLAQLRKQDASPKIGTYLFSIYSVLCLHLINAGIIWGVLMLVATLG